MERKRFTLIALFLVIALMGMLALSAAHAQAQEFWKSKFARFSAIAGETLAAGDVVCINADSSRAFKADDDNTARIPAIGVVGKGGAQGSVVEIVVSGILGGQTAASAGSKLYLSATAGAITTAHTAYGQVIGMVMPSDLAASRAASGSAIYFINVQPGIRATD